MKLEVIEMNKVNDGSRDNNQNHLSLIFATEALKSFITTGKQNTDVVKDLTGIIPGVNLTSTCVETIFLASFFLKRIQFASLVKSWSTNAMLRKVSQLLYDRIETFIK